MSDRVPELPEGDQAAPKQLGTPGWLLVFGVVLIGLGASVFSVLGALGKLDREPTSEDCGRDAILIGQALPGDSFTSEPWGFLTALVLVLSIVVLVRLANRGWLVAALAVSLGILALSAFSVITHEPRISGTYLCSFTE